jgi:asparaginyl-tRNA synthetase
VSYFTHNANFRNTPIITASDAGALFRVSLDLANLPRTPESKVDSPQDFFGTRRS